ncbi:hypothetical protein [Peribacillus loiseleuriae]|uniref:Uncharacterized protein n=1 Tax=Peribacillus loiseleuriae TaxID=1679170 RepID=A0A0K9GT59_9BACI|nr:hypothetical protein [Peribacillus loiseleuriae]KMY49879.1 hypothetical protein AC625_10350 [Peribacillus loiseleuriae]
MSFAELFSLSEIWEIAGPLIITAISTLVTGIVSIIILKSIPKGLIKEVIRIFLVVAIVGITLGTLYISAGIWGT